MQTEDQYHVWALRQSEKRERERERGNKNIL